MSLCELCPRMCGADRAGGRLGFCRASAGPRLFRWGPHFGEEPPLVGENGSGCIFFSNCTMKCLYCQNSPWSWRGGGEDVTVGRLSGIMRELAVKYRCSNWNLVSPTPYLPSIREAVKPLLDEGVRLPFVYNSSGYERVETLEEYADLCDIALFDLRYSRNETALAASSAPRYVEASRAALKSLYSRLGPLAAAPENGARLPENGARLPSKNGDSPLNNGARLLENGARLPLDGSIIAKKGVIVRILVLPGHAEEAVENLAWIADELSNEVHISVMSQYTPSYLAKETAPWNRGVTEEEYSLVTDAAEALGFENGWIQGFESRNPEASLLGENMPPGEGVVG